MRGVGNLSIQQTLSNISKQNAFHHGRQQRTEKPQANAAWFQKYMEFRWDSLQFHRFVRHCYNHRLPMFEEICRLEKCRVRKVP